MKVVIVGGGKIGSNISNNLSSEGHDVIVIDIRKESISKIQDMQDVMCIEGNGADIDVMMEANVEKSDLFIAVTPNDELNMICCLIAGKLGAGRTLARISSPLYFRQLEFTKDSLNLSLAISPELITSDEIMRMIVFPSSAKLEVFSKGRMELVEHRLSNESVLAGMSLASIYKKHKIKFLICAVERGDEIFIPGGDFVLQKGDKINVAASHRNLEGFFKAIGSMNNRMKNVLIIGGGKVCEFLVRQLIDAKMHVRIIEIDNEKCLKLAELFTKDKVDIIHDDGTDQDVLMEHGLAQADVFLSMTNIDEENIVMSLFAKNNSNAMVITKINRENYRDIAFQTGLENIVSPKILTGASVSSFVRAVKFTSGGNIEAFYSLIGNKAEAIEFKVKTAVSGIVNIPLRSVNLKKDILICAIIHNRVVKIPNGNDCIQVNDSVIIISKDDYKFNDISDILDG